MVPGIVGVIGLPSGVRCCRGCWWMSPAVAPPVASFPAHPGEWNHDPGHLTELFDLHSYDGIEVMNGLRLTHLPTTGGRWPRPSTVPPAAPPMPPPVGWTPGAASDLGWRTTTRNNSGTARLTHSQSAFDMLLTDDARKAPRRAARRRVLRQHRPVFRDRVQDDSTWRAPEAESIRSSVGAAACCTKPASAARPTM
jgi:hypothetical protein